MKTFKSGIDKLGLEEVKIVSLCQQKKEQIFYNDAKIKCLNQCNISASFLRKFPLILRT